jgi:hypothetical protein
MGRVISLDRVRAERLAKKVPTAVGVVAHLALREEFDELVSRLGGSWGQGTTYLTSEYPYIGLLAFDPERISRGAPLLFSGRTKEAFMAALTDSSSFIGERICGWKLYVTVADAAAMRSRILSKSPGSYFT